MFNWIFLLFALFIIACGSTHIMEIWNIWHGSYWLSGYVKAFTALASVPTAILLIKLVPKALQLPSMENLEEKNRELERSEKLLEEQNKQLEQSNKEMESFSYSVSHDLRAPLRHINSFIKLINEKNDVGLDDDSKKYLNQIETSSNQMSALIDDLLNYSRLARRELHKSEINLDDLIFTTVDLKKIQYPNNKIEWHIERGLPTINGDVSLLRDGLLILLDNAIKYSRNKTLSKIEIGRFKEDKKEIIIFIKDNGVGFDMKYYNKIFGIFQRLHTTNEFEGSGIGLANLKRIIDRHEGKVWAEGKVNEGATFYFSLPK